MHRHKANKKPLGATNTKGLTTDTNGWNSATANRSGKALAMQIVHTPPSKVRDLAAIRDRHPGTSCAAQRDRLMEALGRYALTSFEGTRYLDCYDTRKRISELKDEGVPIDRHWVTIVTECGQKHRVRLYVLNSAIRQAYLGKGEL